MRDVRDAILSAQAGPVRPPVGGPVRAALGRRVGQAVAVTARYERISTDRDQRAVALLCDVREARGDRYIADHCWVPWTSALFGTYRPGVGARLHLVAMVWPYRRRDGSQDYTLYPLVVSAATAAPAEQQEEEGDTIYA